MYGERTEVSKLFLKGGIAVDLTEEQAIQVAKYIMILPEWKKMRVAGRTFCANDIDLERARNHAKPQLQLFEEETVKKQARDIGL